MRAAVINSTRSVLATETSSVTIAMIAVITVVTIADATDAA